MTTLLSSVGREFRTLWSLISRAGANSERLSHAEQLDEFYRGQAEHYDSFRERLLHGRRDIVERVLDMAPDGFSWIDVGGGTGKLLEFAGSHLARAKSVTILDPCRPLLDIAATRARGSGNVRCILGEAETFQPDFPVDVVTFSYSLSMIPGWWRALYGARDWLRPGGMIAIVDFYVSMKRPMRDTERHSWATRTGWPVWFAFDDVHLRADVLPFVEDCFQRRYLSERRGRVPYLPFVRVPYFQYVGVKSV